MLAQNLPSPYRSHNKPTPLRKEHGFHHDYKESRLELKAACVHGILLAGHLLSQLKPLFDYLKGTDKAEVQLDLRDKATRINVLPEV